MMLGDRLKGFDKFAQNVKIIAGSSHLPFAQSIANNLNIKLTPVILDHFANGERRVEIGENIRKRDLFIIQTGSNNQTDSINDIIMETLIMIDAAKRSHAKSITLIMPNFPYARSDKKDRPRAPISARLIANLLETAGLDRLMVMDLHASQIQGFFNIPVDNLYSVNYMAKWINSIEDGELKELKESGMVLVSPDAGGIKRMLALADKVSLPTIIMHKQRDHTKKSHVESTTLVGDRDIIVGKTCIIVDDMADTMGTVVKASQTLIEMGAKQVIVLVTHGILSNPATKRLNEANYIMKIVCTNSLPHHLQQFETDKLEEIDVSDLFAKAIKCIVKGGSISELFI